MNTLTRYLNYLILGLLTAIVSVPTTSWGHGFVGLPIDRQSNCKSTGGHWSGYIVDDGCRTAAAIEPTDADKAYPTDQFHEFSINTFSATTPINQILDQLQQGMVCSANDPKKRSMSVPTKDWTKEPLTSGSSLNIKLFMTAVHVPSRAFVFITKPGFNSATTSVSVGDLVPLGGVHPITATDVQQPQSGTIPKGLWASGVVQLPVVLPNGQTGPAVIVVIWARDDDKGETFVMCSDVTFGGGQIPVKRYLIGTFVDPATKTAKPGDSIRHRVISNGNDVSDQKVTLNANNLDPTQWSKQLKDLITNQDIEIGHEENGKIEFDDTNAKRNHVYYKHDGAMQNMTVIDGEGPAPTPVAEITGPVDLVSGQPYTFTGTLRNAQNTPQYAWAPVLITNNISSKTVTGPAPVVTQPTDFIVRLNTRDGQTGANYTATHAVRVSPATGFPQWKPNGGYNSGSEVSNHGVNYRCKQGAAGAWCGQDVNEPGKPGSTFWQRAWDVVP
ncbi:lytic polysaccharide monooxygenase [Pseudomonas sp. KBW05]|uniref:lytic polysaccharide monooxygenase n=1 Tax=Pseudomonas sp. KBW05 TaxID=2153360 RepID=UPI000F5A197F|nr:lytic polysaccharide monooxygenase [Pseudomonas sp. KBW05]RQO52975.1 hypothetical protein DBR46_17495 [Pseudomonas sp. KBW05]